MLFLWIVSGLGVIVTRRFSSKAVGDNQRAGFVTCILLTVVALGIVAALRLPAARASWPAIIPVAVFLLGLGMALQWYACLQPLVLAKAIAAGPAEARFVARHRFIRNLSVGGLLAMIGLSLSFENWASLLIMCVPCCALTLLRIRAARADGKAGTAA